MSGRSSVVQPAARALHRALAGANPTIPARWFWDERGARLHRERMRAPDHYPAHIERELYAAYAPMLVGLFEPREVADLAPGASRHVRALVDAMLGCAPDGARCALLDADPARVQASVRGLAATYPRLRVRGAVGDWRSGWRLGRGGARLHLLSGAGPDGLDPGVLPMLLRAMSRRLEPDDTLVLGVDLGRDPAGLLRACDDADGLAAAFHHNALRGINEGLGAGFDPDDFTFEARWDGARRWVETRLRPRRALRVTLGSGGALSLDPGRPLVTGRVGTWTRGAFRERAVAAGLELSAWLADADERRALVVLRRARGKRPRTPDL